MVKLSKEVPIELAPGWTLSYYKSKRLYTLYEPEHTVLRILMSAPGQKMNYLQLLSALREAGQNLDIERLREAVRRIRVVFAKWDAYKGSAYIRGDAITGYFYNPSGKT